MLQHSVAWLNPCRLSEGSYPSPPPQTATDCHSPPPQTSTDSHSTLASCILCWNLIMFISPSYSTHTHSLLCVFSTQMKINWIKITGTVFQPNYDVGDELFYSRLKYDVSMYDTCCLGSWSFMAHDEILLKNVISTCTGDSTSFVEVHVACNLYFY
jgi:hypothetical protein